MHWALLCCNWDKFTVTEPMFGSPEMTLRFINSYFPPFCKLCFSRSYHRFLFSRLSTSMSLLFWMVVFTYRPLCSFGKLTFSHHNTYYDLLNEPQFLMTLYKDLLHKAEFSMMLLHNCFFDKWMIMVSNKFALPLGFQFTVACLPVTASLWLTIPYCNL